MKGLYVHIPFCLQKCKYCDFNSFTACQEDKSAYLNMLISDMERYFGEAVDSVFIGGGTPTSLPAQAVEELLKKIGEIFHLSADCEITAEANPKTVDREKLEIMRKNGVNRLSIGVQSLNDAELKALGRVHTAAEAEETVRLAKEYFENVSIDLMCAIPGQTTESFEQNLRRALALETEHISCYSLIMEEGTPLFDEYKRGSLALPNEDEDRAIYELACKRLGEHRYHQYEISNFARNGRESRHNKKYWRCEEYIGVGLSAHSYIDGVRFSNTDNFSSYINGCLAPYEREILTFEDKMSEFMYMGLRMTEGVSKSEFYDRFGKSIEDVFNRPVSKFKKLGMIEEENGKIRLSHKAISVSNQIMCEFLL